LGWYNYEGGTLWPFLNAASPLERQRLFLCPSDDEPRYMGKFPQLTPDTNFPRNFSYNFSMVYGRLAARSGALGVGTSPQPDPKSVSQDPHL
jgi:hypothetical protein